MTDLDIDHLTPGPWHRLTVRDEPAKARIHLTHPDNCHGPRCRIGRATAMFTEGLPLGEYQIRVSGLGAEYRHADGTAVEGRPTRLDPVPMSREQADRYANLADEALNAYRHEDLCNCDTWPIGCHSGYKPGEWDTSVWYAALPALLAAVYADIATEEQP